MTRWYSARTIQPVGPFPSTRAVASTKVWNDQMIIRYQVCDRKVKENIILLTLNTLLTNSTAFHSAGDIVTPLKKCALRSAASIESMTWRCRMSVLNLVK